VGDSKERRGSWGPHLLRGRIRIRAEATQGPRLGAAWPHSHRDGRRRRPRPGVDRWDLRASIYQDPKNEREVQDTLETIFRARALDYLRERDTVPYSTKRYIPDFTFNRLGLAVEVKYCKDKDREKDPIDEINADIVGYAGRYDRTIFVIYDLGFIRDVPQFSRDIEKNPNVHVVIVKK
jgi:hypothetical protein